MIGLFSAAWFYIQSDSRALARILLGSSFNPRNSVFIRNKKAWHDARPIADLNDIRSITQTQRKYGKRTKNRIVHSKNGTASLFDSRISRYARRALFQRLSAGSTRQTQGVSGAARKVSSPPIRIGQISKHY
jgi:hypothetical protein